MIFKKNQLFDYCLKRVKVQAHAHHTISPLNGSYEATIKTQPLKAQIRKSNA